MRELPGRIAAGRLKSREDIFLGIGKIPEALLMRFKAENMGELVPKVRDD